MRLASCLRSSRQTKYDERSIRNTSCPVQPSVHYWYEVFVTRVTVIVVELDEQVVKFVPKI